jgi:hypothetical protein
LWIDSTYGSGTSNILRWRDSSVTGLTTLSGTDDNGTTLVYTPGYEEVYINGVLQFRGSDYAATNGTSITGLTALVAGDVVEVIAPSAAQFGDYYTQAQSDAKYPIMSTTPISGFRNATINGGMDIWQRSTSSTTNGAYNSVDRWWMYYNAGTATFSRESSVVPVGFQYALKVAQASATASMVIYQVIETSNAVRLAGKTVTLSVYLASTAAVTINPDVSYTTSVDTAVSGSWTNITATPASWSVPSGSTYARYTATLTIPSTAKSIRIGFGPASITAGTSFYITGVQFEEGTTATPFEQRPIGTELMLCERYYQVIVVPNTSYAAMYVSGTNTFYGFAMSLGTKMRTAPSGSYVYISGTQYWVIPGTAALSANSATGITIGTTDSAFKLNQTRQAGNGTPTSGNTYLWEADFSVALSAEL